jgi:hypothetical protein
MNGRFQNIIFIELLLICAFSFSGCIKPFLAPPSANNLSFLVVDGTVTVGSPVRIKLSRTKNLVDTVETQPEFGAQLQLESESGTVFPFITTDFGEYTAENVTEIQRYRLRIKTQDGNEYLSDFVETRVSPPIDSVEWVEDDDVYIYVNTHDDQSTTRYYRWEFEETVEYRAVYDSNIEFRNGELIFIGPDEMRYACFKYFPSHEILVASSGALGADVISDFLLTRIPNDNSKINPRYSMLVKQYALTADAYQYWQIVKQNSEQTGNIFDPQPSQLYGNIKNVNRPDEPVIGYLSASTVAEKRIFIRQSQLDEIKYPNNEFCKEIFISPSQAPEYLASGRLMPAYFTQGALAIAPAVCVDCRLSGGSTAKPPYW